jgi:hypothetical protein
MRQPDWSEILGGEFFDTVIPPARVNDIPSHNLISFRAFIFVQVVCDEHGVDPTGTVSEHADIFLCVRAIEVVVSIVGPVPTCASKQPVRQLSPALFRSSLPNTPSLLPSCSTAVKAISSWSASMCISTKLLAVVMCPVLCWWTWWVVACALSHYT